MICVFFISMLVFGMFVHFLQVVQLCQYLIYLCAMQYGALIIVTLQ